MKPKPQLEIYIEADTNRSGCIQLQTEHTNSRLSSKETEPGWDCGSAVRCLPSMQEALRAFPSTA